MISLRAGDLARASRAADRAPRRRRHWARWCRTDNWPPAPPRSAVSALNSVDLPTLGRPTMPHLKPMSCPTSERNWLRRGMGGPRAKGKGRADIPKGRRATTAPAGSSFAVDRRTEEIFETPPQSRVDDRHRARRAKLFEARHAKLRGAEAAGRDAGKMRQIRSDIQRDAVETHPMAQAHAERRDLVLGRLEARTTRLVRSRHPDADAVGAALRANAQSSSAAISQPSSAQTKARTSRRRRERSSIT